MVSPSRNRIKTSSRRLVLKRTFHYHYQRCLIFIGVITTLIVLVLNRMDISPIDISPFPSSSTNKLSITSSTPISPAGEVTKSSSTAYVDYMTNSQNKTLKAITSNNAFNLEKENSDIQLSNTKGFASLSSSSALAVLPTAAQLEVQLNSLNKQLCPSSSSSYSASKIYDLAKKQSFGFFSDIPCQSWNRMRQITSKQIKHAYPDNPNFRIHIPHSWYQMNYEPDFSCQFEERVGGNGNGDGPKWICDPHRYIELSKQRKALRRKQRYAKSEKEALFIVQDDKVDTDAYIHERTPGCVIYSIGSNGDFQFEEGVQNLLGVEQCEIHIFDMGDYEQYMPQGLNLHFHRWGITSSQNLAKGDTKPSQAFYEGSIIKKFSRWFGFRQEKFKTFGETVELLGHQHLPAIDVLKIDCEGCEWDVYRDWFGSEIPRIGQILVEVHRSPRDKAIEFFDEMYKEGYVTFHKEPNIKYAGGNCVEYGFLKLDKDYFDLK